MAAARAFIDMTTQRGGAASLDSGEHLEVHPGEPSRASIDESRSCVSYDVGQLQEWPDHLRRIFFGLRWGRQWKRIQWACDGSEM